MTTTGMAAQMLDRIRAHYLTPPRNVNPAHMTEQDALTGAVMLTEVPAPRSGRRADAIVVGLTRARAGIDGIEIKVSRADWLRELEQPIKADGWFPHTHRWWVAAPSQSLVKPEELPPGWGLMVPSARSQKRMTTVIKPVDREPEITWPVLCEIAKKMDRRRASEVAAEAGRLSKVAEQNAMAAAESSYTRRRGDEEAIGKALLDITGLEPWRLRYLDEHLADDLRSVVRAVFVAAVAADGAETDLQVLTDIVRRQLDRHRNATDQYTAALDAITNAAAGGRA
jgi:hypothetical protein